MSERIVEVEWEDAMGADGWQPRVTWPKEEYGLCHTVGYVRESGDRGILIVNGFTKSWRGDDRDDCAMFIPKSQIRKVTELSRKRR